MPPLMPPLMRARMLGRSIRLCQPKGSYMAYLTLAFEGGGVEAWELPPADDTVAIS